VIYFCIYTICKEYWPKKSAMMNHPSYVDFQRVKLSFIRSVRILRNP